MHIPPCKVAILRKESLDCCRCERSCRCRGLAAFRGTRNLSLGARAGNPRPDGLVDSLEPLLRRVYEARPQRRSMTTERLAVAAGLDEESVKVALVRLQLSAFVGVDERGWHRSLGQGR